MPMPLVLIESPFAAPEPELLRLNVDYARAAMHDCLVNHGEAPYASHLLYTQPGVLDDNVPEQRMLGINAGLDWGAMAAKTVVYTDLGMSRGMRFGIDRAEREGRPIEYRSLPGWTALKAAIEASIATRPAYETSANRVVCAFEAWKRP